MLTQEVWMNVKVLAQQGHSIRAVAEMTGLSRQTVRKVLAETVPRGYASRAVKVKKLDAFEDWLTNALMNRPWARASVLYRELVDQGFAGHYELVKRWVRGRRAEHQAARRACVRFETEPGIEGQFDWKGPVTGLLADEPERKVWIFRLVLGYSRFRVTRATTCTTLAGILTDLIWVFEKMGGLPERLVFDNFKAAVLVPRPNLRLHPVFADFCAHYHLQPAPALPYSPQRKGKTERAFLDLENSELLRQAYGSVDALQSALELDDLRHAASVVSTTGQTPHDRLVRERPFLHPLPAVRFDPREVETRRVLTDCTISYRGAFYSVPARLVGKRVTVKADPVGTRFEVLDLTESLGTYPVLPKGQRLILDAHVAELRRTRWDRLKPASEPSPKVEAAPVAPTLVSWPTVEVASRPIADYLSVLEVTP